MAGSSWSAAVTVNYELSLAAVTLDDELEAHVLYSEEDKVRELLESHKFSPRVLGTCFLIASFISNTSTLDLLESSMNKKMPQPESPQDVLEAVFDSDLVWDRDMNILLSKKVGKKPHPLGKEPHPPGYLNYLTFYDLIKILVSSYDLPMIIKSHLEIFNNGKLTQIKKFEPLFQEAYDNFLQGRMRPLSTTATPESFLAILLGFKCLTKEGALSEWKVLKIEHPSVAGKINEYKFLKHLNFLFLECELFKELETERFSKNRWKGHVSKRRGEETEEKIKTTSISHTMTIPVLGVPHTLKFNLLKTEKEPEFIVISIYSGFNKDFCLNMETINFNNENIWSIGLNLWDCETDFPQGSQLTKDNFKNTHASYLKAVSEFVSQIQAEHPNAQIYLEGASFGGFFVTSYALLQSIYDGKVFSKKQDLGEIYKKFSQEAFDELFPDRQISPVRGIISHAGAIHNMNKIVLEKLSVPILQYLAVPGFFSYNYDDDSVSRDEIKDTLIHSDYVEVFITREGAQSYGGDSGKNEHLTTRGHFRGDPHSELTERAAIIRFINRVGEKRSLSSVHQETQGRRLKILQGRNLPPYITQKDVEQYLSNLRNTQLFIEKNKDLTPEQLLEHHLEDVEAVIIKSLVDASMVSEDISKMIQRDFRLKNYVPLLEARKQGQQNWPELLKKFDGIDIRSREFESKFEDTFRNPELSDILKKNKNLIEQQLKEYTSTKDMWKAAGRKVLMANRAVRAIKERSQKS